MMVDLWAVQEDADGWRLFYDGEPWPAEPKPSRQEAEEYLERVQRRYRGDSPRLFLNAEPGENGPERGGPWRYTYPSLNGDGEDTGVIHTSRLEDAKKVLRAKLERKRLPNGIAWEIETG